MYVAVATVGNWWHSLQPKLVELIIVGPGAHVQRFSRSSSSRLANLPLHGTVTVTGSGYVVVVDVIVDELRQVLSHTYLSRLVVDGMQLELPHPSQLHDEDEEME